MNTQNNLRFADSDSSNYVAFRAPATVSANILWTLPAIDGSSGQVLSTNGSGTLAWASNGGGASGTGSPEGVLTGSVGDTYRRTDGGAGTTFYVKESGNATNTGWVAINARATITNTALVLSGFGVPVGTADINGTYTNMGLMNGYSYWERTNASPELIRVYYSPSDGYKIYNNNDSAAYYRNSVNYTDGGVWERTHANASTTVGTITNGLANAETDGPLTLTGFGTPTGSSSINGAYQFMLTSGGYKKWAKTTSLGELIEIYYNASDGYRIHNIDDGAVYYKNNASYTDTGVWELVHANASTTVGSVTGGIAQANAGNGITLSGFGVPTGATDINLVYRYMGTLAGYPYYQGVLSNGEFMTIYYNSTDGYRIENQTDAAIYYKNGVNYVAGSTWTKVHANASTTIGSVTSVDNGGNLETVTASKTLNAGHNQRTFINTGAGALVTLTLPSANQAGLTYKFINRTGSGLRILAAGSDTIVDTTTSSVGGGYVQTTVSGGVIEIMSVEYNKWIITNSRGAITVN
jgi:hypothetical protein